MADKDEVPNTPALWEWRLREVEKQLDRMTALQATLATKDDLKRLEASLQTMAEAQREKDDRTFDVKKSLFPPMVVGIIIAAANWALSFAHAAK